MASAAKLLLRASSVKRDSRAVVMGSNYPLFEGIAGGACPKCTGGLRLVGPRDIDISTFRLSLEMHKLMRGAGISSKVLVMPSDFYKGADSGRLRALRASYAVPASFRKLMDEFRISEDETVFRLESSFKGQAQKLLRSVNREGLLGTRIREGEKAVIETGPLGKYAAIPLGTVSENETRVPLCQIICSAVYEFLGREFTHFFGIVDRSEWACINQGTTVAKALGKLKMEALLIGLMGANGSVRLMGLERY